jgi:hypothetical protein
MVNRIWALRMGKGIVGTPNDFGVLGERPSNPELLDWLATEFVASGWSIKKLDRMILLSSTYQQTQSARRRLEGEFIRDSVLQVSGALNPKRGGRPIKTPLEPEIYDLIFTEGEPDNLWPVALDQTEFDRRSLYLVNKRTVRLPFLANFDQPDNMTSCAQRPTSTHPLQALSLMNSSFMQGAAKRFAARIDSECKSQDCRIRTAYLHALARDPRPAELTMARQFFAEAARSKTSVSRSSTVTNSSTSHETPRSPSRDGSHTGPVASPCRDPAQHQVVRQQLPLDLNAVA